MDNPQTINAPQFICKGGKFMVQNNNRNNNRNNNEVPDFSEGIDENIESSMPPNYNNEPPLDDGSAYGAPNNNEPTMEEPHEPNLEDPHLNIDDPVKRVSDQSREDEFATEITADDHREEKRLFNDEGDQANSVMGWTALILSIASFFMMPVILGGAGIILGFIARNRGANTLGNTAIVAGIASILIALFIIPFV